MHAVYLSIYLYIYIYIYLSIYVLVVYVPILRGKQYLGYTIKCGS